MEESIFRESLELLKEAREGLTRDAQGRARERLDEVIDRMQQALDDGTYKRLSSREILEFLSHALIAGGKFAELIKAFLDSLP
jgi:vacuolar-type H+-ATPase subunit H